jgi:hypothetical protein
MKLKNKILFPLALNQDFGGKCTKKALITYSSDGYDSAYGNIATRHREKSQGGQR